MSSVVTAVTGSAVAGAVAGSAIVGAGASYLSSTAQADAAGEASDAEVQANRENIAFQKAIFNQQREDAAPWREIGASSLKKLKQGVESGSYNPGSFDFNFEADPGYQFRKEEGMNALDASAASRGRLQSGAQARATTRYASNLASQEYGNAFNRSLTEYKTDASRKQGQFNRLASLSRVGQVANQNTSTARGQMARSVGQSTQATGIALARGARGQGQARSSGYQNMAAATNQGVQNYLLYDMLGSG
jgi:hypothetical protein